MGRQAPKYSPLVGLAKKADAGPLSAGDTEGVGEVYLLDQAVSFEHTERLDLKTAIKLTTNPCRIDW